MTEMVAKVNMSKEISSADLLFQVLMTWGKKVMAEILPAVMPKSCIEVISSDADLRMCKYAAVKIGN